MSDLEINIKRCFKTHFEKGEKVEKIIIKESESEQVENEE